MVKNVFTIKNGKVAFNMSCEWQARHLFPSAGNIRTLENLRKEDLDVTLELLTNANVVAFCRMYNTILQQQNEGGVFDAHYIIDSPRALTRTQMRLHAERVERGVFDPYYTAYTHIGQATLGKTHWAKHIGQSTLGKPHRRNK